MSDCWRTLDPPRTMPDTATRRVRFTDPPLAVDSSTHVRIEFRDAGVAVYGWSYRDGVLTFEIGSRES